MVDGQPQPGMTFGDAADVPQRVRRQHGDRHAGLLRRCPQPVERAVLQPLPRRIVQEGVAQPEHAGLLPPGGDVGAGGCVIERQRSQDGEAARIVAHRLERHRGGIRVPAGRMDHRGIHAALVHQRDRLLRGEMRHLAVREVARQSGSPEVDLCVDDLHGVSLPSFFRREAGQFRARVQAGATGVGYAASPSGSSSASATASPS